MVKEEKQKALDAALAQIEKQFGKGSVMKLGDKGANMQIETIPTGCLSVIGYGDPVVTKGLNMLYGPGNDLVSATAMTAAGAHLILPKNMFPYHLMPHGAMKIL